MTEELGLHELTERYKPGRTLAKQRKTRNDAKRIEYSGGLKR